MASTASLEKPPVLRSGSAHPDPPPRRGPPSLHVLITLIVVLPIAAVSVALVFITTMTSRSIAEQLGREILERATAQVQSHIQSYLGSAMRVSDLYARRLEDDMLSPADLAAWERTMFHDLAANPDVASICFANPSGDCTWLLHAHDRLELGLVDGRYRDRATEWPVSADGKVDRDHPIRVYHYDALQRPWYEQALRSEQPIWTPIYFWFGQQGSAFETGTGYTRAIRNRDGSLRGVLVIDITLGSISRHLQRLPLTQSGSVFVVDETGLLVAASQGEVNSADGRRLPVDQSGTAAGRAVAGLVSPGVHGAEIEADVEQTHRVDLAGEPARAHVLEIRPYPGIHWHIVTVLPESSFLSGASSLQRRAILMILAAITGGLILGYFLSRKLSDPLMQLTAHVARVGGGDFEARLHLSSAAELNRLADEVNHMAGGLKQRLVLEQSMAVAEQIQQSLLPDSIPELPGLQIAACSKYCESTGGDYYDFVEIPSSDGNRTLIVVGDVTGHGLGAALLMATARGTLRAACVDATSLGHILSHTNQVLAGSARHGMFMTLSLVSVDPKTQTIHWSSAGHDPVIVYHPDSDSFEELSSGDMPLGIEVDIEYREFSRPCATPGTIILIGTDGIWEARRDDGEMFGKPRLKEVIRHHHGSAEQLADAIRSAMYSWVGEAPLQDDVTFVILKVVP